MKKKILKTMYYIPFILHLMFYLFIIFIDGIANLKFLEVILLLGALFICGLCFSNDNKKSKIIGPITLFITTFILIVTGIENTYFTLFETIDALLILIYYFMLLLITKKKVHLISTSIVIFILLILFVPIKFQYKDGGTIEYKSLSYKYIKWNRLRNNGSYYEGIDIYWFPKNIFSLEYYAPIELPIVTVTNDKQEVICNNGSYNWTETVDEQEKQETGLSIEPIQMDYDDIIVVRDNTELKINTQYTISEIKYTEYKEEYKDKEFTPIYQIIDYEKYSKSIDLKDLDNGYYIFKFDIKGEKSSTATYSFKVEVKN